MASRSRLRSRRRSRLARMKSSQVSSPEALESLLGTWLVESVFFGPDGMTAGEGHAFHDYKGVEVRFDEGCELSWSVPGVKEPLPLFQTTNFYIDKDSLELMGSGDGQSFLFDVEVGSGALTMSTHILSQDQDLAGTLRLCLVKSTRPPDSHLAGFTLQGALDEEMFVDCTLSSCDGCVFQAHKTVLDCSVPGMSLPNWSVLVASLPAPVVKVLLSYVYSHHLPTSVSLENVVGLRSALYGQPHLKHLSELCSSFIGSQDLKQKLMGLVDELQAHVVTAKAMVENTDITNPAKVKYTLELLAKEAASGAAKFLLLCQLYSQNKNNFSKPEKQEVLEYVQARVVVFVDLLSELLEAALAKYASLTEAQRLEIANYITKDVEKVWDLINLTCDQAKVAMASRHKAFSGSARAELKPSHLFRLAMRARESKRMASLAKEFEDFIMASSSKRLAFKELSEAEKAAKILHAMEGLEKEGKTLRGQLLGMKTHILVDNALDWNTFKVLTSLACTYVAWGLRRGRVLRESMLPTLLKAAKFVGRTDLNECLVFLELLTEAEAHSLREEAPTPTPLPNLSECNVKGEGGLSAGILSLLGSQLKADMEFVLPGSDGESDVVFPAHRVVVAARCEWIKRALLSGMKEDIDRRIVVRDCSESTFRLFLKYLYGGLLDLGEIGTQAVVELLAMADHYETPVLRGRCESSLVASVEDSTVFPLLQVADRYSTRRLREVALKHILADPEVIMREVEDYSDLGEELKTELRGLLSSPTDPRLLLHHGTQDAPRRDSSSDENSSPVADPLVAEFRGKLEQMRTSIEGMMGECPDDEPLKTSLLAADMDINRAVNFYLNNYL